MFRLWSTLAHNLGFTLTFVRVLIRLGLAVGFDVWLSLVAFERRYLISQSLVLGSEFLILIVEHLDVIEDTNQDFPTLAVEILLVWV